MKKILIEVLEQVNDICGTKLEYKQEITWAWILNNGKDEVGAVHIHSENEEDFAQALLQGLARQHLLKLYDKTTNSK